jgi:hypothetical protein
LIREPCQAESVILRTSSSSSWMARNIWSRKLASTTSGAPTGSPRGFRVVRARNQELDENIRSVVDTIGRAIDEWEARARHPPSLRFAIDYRTALGRLRFARARLVPSRREEGAGHKR